MEYRIEKVEGNIEIAPKVFRLRINGTFQATPGQFFMLRAWKDEPLLSRPISVNTCDEKGITFLYQNVGKGTDILSRLKSGDEVKLLGPSGNGFPVDKMEGKVAIVTGGVGIAPMLYVAEKLKKCKVDLYAGFKEEVYIVDEFKRYVDNIMISTEKGNVGYKGYVTDMLKLENYDVILCCGPEVMMNKVVSMAKEKNVEIYVSMEKKMACGIGACLGCTCKTKSGNKRCCKDGPVFSGEELI